MAPLIVAGVMAVMQVANGYHKGNMIREQNRLRRRVDDINVEALELQAFDETAFGAGESAKYDNVVNTTIAEQRAAMGANNVDIGYGTAQEIQTETKNIGLINKLEIERRARDKVSGIKRQIKNVRLGSNMATLQSELDAGAAMSQGIMQGASTMASGYAKGAG